MRSQYSFLESWHKKIGRILFLRWNSLQTKCPFDWNLDNVRFISSIAPPRHVRTSGRDACWASPPAINQWLNWVIRWVVEHRQIPKLIILFGEGVPLRRSWSPPKKHEEPKKASEVKLYKITLVMICRCESFRLHLSLSDSAQHPRLQVFRTAGLTCICIDMFLRETENTPFFCSRHTRCCNSGGICKICKARSMKAC